jgi:hypothetical protein
VRRLRARFGEGHGGDPEAWVLLFFEELRMLSRRCFTRKWLTLFSCIGVVALALFVGAAEPQKRTSTPAVVDLSRYPPRVPDWLWTDQRRSAVVDPNTRRDIEADLLFLKPLEELADTTLADKKKAEIARRIAGALSLGDLAADAVLQTHHAERLRLAVQIDPKFDAKNRRTLTEAANLFLKAALDDSVVEEAMADSTSKPSPIPEMYRTDGSEVVRDPYGNKVYTDKYSLYLTSRQKPTDAAAFKTHLRGVLSRPDGDPAVLCVSLFTGGDKNGQPFMWWGKTYVGFYNDPVQQLRRLAPHQGFLSISLNADRMKAGEPNAEDPVFWASKVGHELLHSLGYDHPGYNDAADRDANNPAGKRAFIVAYELALLKHLQKRGK